MLHIISLLLINYKRDKRTFTSANKPVLYTIIVLCNNAASLIIRSHTPYTIYNLSHYGRHAKYQDQQLKELQEKITNISDQNQFKADQDAVQAAQMEMLTTLRTIRAAMVATTNNSSEGGSASSQQEVKALKEENDKLKKINTKQRYRIDHLISGVEEMQKKLEA